MTEQTPENVATAQSLPIQIHAQYVKDQSFENPNAPETLRAGQDAPKMDININMDATKIESDKIENLYEVRLRLSATAKREDSTVYVAEVEYAAATSLSNVPDEHHHPLLLIEIPRIIFPFARQVMADMTQNGGYPPLMMSPVDFQQLYLQQFGQQQQEEAAAAGAAN